MSRESRRRQRKQRRKMKAAERAARRNLRAQLRNAEAQARATQQRIIDQMKIDSEERKKQADAYAASLLKVQTDAEANMKAMQDAQIMNERARVERERIAGANQAFANRAAAGLQIQPAASTPSAAGTPMFKRRQYQFSSGTTKKPSYAGLSTTQSGMINI